MARFTCTGTKMNLKPFSGSDKIMARPKRKLVPGHGFALKKLLFSFSKKQRKNGVRINTESRLVNDISGQSDITDNGGAKKPDDSATIFIQESLVFMRKTSHVCASFINTNAFIRYAVALLVAVSVKPGLLLLKLLQIPMCWKWMHGRSRLLKYHLDKFIMINGSKGTKTNITTSAAQINKWRLFEIDILSTMDVYPIDSFLVGISVLLVYGVLYRLFFYAVHRFSSKNDSK
ncbi:hypothetical protein ABFS83_04G179000 [Erythranthe nasuta]